MEKLQTGLSFDWS